MRKAVFLLVGVLFLPCLSVTIKSQDVPAELTRKYRVAQKSAMYTLGSWAVINMGTGLYGWTQHTGENKYFHQMNFFWNTVNLTIAGIGLYGYSKDDLSSVTASGLADRYHSSEKVYLINAGLDILYMGTGILLKSAADKNKAQQLRFKGYGNSLLLQGGFLFVFDLVMYGIMRSQRLHIASNFTLSTNMQGLLLSYQHVF